MSFNNLSDNDDDLFEDSPQVTSNPINENSILNDFRSIIENTDIDVDKIGSMLMRSKLALTLYESAHTFIFDTSSYARTSFNTLNALTDGQFQYNLYCDILEESIFRRIIILDFVNAISQENDKKIFDKIAEVFKIDMDQKFIFTYFYSMQKILAFVIEDNIELYKKVCAQCKREPALAILEKSLEQARFYIAPEVHINNVFSNIRKSLDHGYKS